MTCRGASFNRTFRTILVPTLALVLVAATSTLVGAQSAPAPDASYNIVWEPVSGFTGQSGAYVGINAVQGLKAYFPETGLRLVSEKEPSSWAVSLALTGFGYAGEMQSVTPATLSTTGNRVDFARTGPLSEWYLNDPAGVQQWVSLSAAPPDLLEQGGPLTLEFTLATGLTPRLSGGATILDLSDLDGTVLAQYNIWQITSAAGRTLPAELQLVTDGQGSVTGVRIAVSVSADDYPLSVGMAAGFPKTLTLPPPTDSVAVAAVPVSPEEALLVPANDECSGAVTVVQGTSCVPTAGNSATATQSIPPSTCTGFTSAQALDVWYKFVATTTNPTIQLTGTGGLDSIVELRSGACNGAFVTCADATVGNGVETIAASGLTIGATYFVRVYGWFATTPTGTFNLCVFAPVAPANDQCAAALPLTLNQIATGTNNAAANDYSITAPTATCFPGVGQTTTTAVGRDTVWSFTAPATDTYSFKVQTTDAAGSGNLALYTIPGPSCPATGGQACAATLVGANRNSNTGQFTAAEEVYCQSIAAGAKVFLFVDEAAASTTGGGYTIEVSKCVKETEPNNTPATANTYGFANSCPMEGTISAGTAPRDVDFFALGAPAANSRVFAIGDSVQANSTDPDMRVTNTTDSIEYDDADNTTPWGSLGPNIAGRPLTGVASYIEMTHFTSGSTSEPYRLYAVVQPPGAGLGGSSATAEVNDGTNNSLAGANSAGNNFFSGTISSPTDLDLYRFAATAGDVIVLGIDGDPLRNLTPFNPAVFLIDNAGAQLLGFTDANTSSSNTAGVGLLATTPTSPGESATWRARYTGVYYAGVTNNGATTLGDYLFSIAVNCQTGAQQSADLGVTKTDSPDPVTAGGLLTYTVTVTNAGTNIALDANMLDPLPAGTTFQSITGLGTGGNWSCTVPVVGTNGTISCTNSSFTSGGSFTFTITVKVNPCIGNVSLNNTVTVSSLTADSNSANNTATSTTTVIDPGTCSDDNACTANDHCVGTICQGDPPPPCDDGNACTANTCNPVSGQCENPTTVFCTASDQCHLVGTCDPGTGVCSNPGALDGTVCNDSNLCTAPDTCQNSACVGANPLFCDDGNVCTTDSCNPATGLCVYANNTNSCDDGNACTVGDQCSQAGFNEKFDGVVAPALPAGWTTSFTGAGQNWVTQSTSSDTPPNSAFGYDGFSGTVVPGEEVLTTPPIAITSATAKLSFRNRWSFESATSCFDASVLEIKIGAGSFTGIVAAGGSFVTGGYTGTVSLTFSNPLAGQSAWCNNSAGYPAYLTTLVNLPAAAAGQTIQLRWRLGFDTSAGAVGQNIDSIAISDVSTCQSGPFASTSTPCGDAEAACTNQDYCNGSGGCTDNGFKPAATACGDPSTSPCDNPDHCSGSNASCVPNYASTSTTCGDAGAACTNQDYCSGTGACTDNGFKPAATACGDPSSGPCDSPDHCSGFDASCDPNHAATTTTCGDAEAQCTNQDYCNGNGGCTDNGFKPAATACGDPSSGPCDSADHCTGTNASCDPNHAPTSTTCGDAETQCIYQDYCDGDGACHDNGFKPTTTPCTDGDACTTGDLCNGAGACSPGGPTNCDDSQCCTNDLCNHDTGCFHTPYTVPPVIVNQPTLGCALLWPPQHGYVDFSVASTGATATSQCGIASIAFGSCTSSQQENAHGVGDGNSNRDCVYTPGTLSVRAERDGACSPIGRSYSSTVVATDVCGNSTTSNSFDIGVFHDRGHAPPPPYYSANPGSNQNDERPGVNGTYGTGCGNGTCGATGTGHDSSDADPEMEISQNASISVGNLSLEKASGGNARLTWSEPTHQPGIIVTRFHVYRLDPVTLFWTQIAEVTKQTTSYLDPVLNDGLNHEYKVTAVIKP